MKHRGELKKRVISCSLQCPGLCHLLAFIPSTGSPSELPRREVLALVDTVSTLPGQPA